MITQIANNKLERSQFILGVLLFCIFITYSLSHGFPESTTYINTAIIFQAIAVLIIMRLIMQNKTTVQPYFAWNASKYKNLKFNYTIKIIGYLIFGILTTLHFLIDYKCKGNVMPLVYDYGIGGILALGLKFFLLERKWHLGLSDKGIIFGSKFDTKLLSWDEIVDYEVDRNNQVIIVKCRKNHPIKSIKLELGKQLRNAEIIFEQALKK